MTPFGRNYDRFPPLPPTGLSWGFVAFAVITVGALAAAVVALT